MGKFCLKSHYVMQDVFAGHDVLIRSNRHSKQTENQNYLSQTLLVYLNDEFLRILKNP